MKRISQLTGVLLLSVVLLSTCRPTESTDTTTKSTRMDSAATKVIESAAHLGTNPTTPPKTTRSGSATN